MKPSVRRTFTTTAAPQTAYAYLADFTNAEEWDPGTRSCTVIEGDGGVGTRYRNVSSFLGRTTTLEYVAEELQPPSRIHFHGTNDQFDGHDHLTLRSQGAGTEITYEAVFSFRGVAQLFAPVVALYLPMLARKTVDQMSARLDALPPTE
ncbi:MAG: SRPBCC family protein [Actinomycetota bacterium]|nr:SRPBCC family protein [Actinomycetota bacterium]